MITFQQPAVAEDWLEFRGPGGQGHSTTTGLPVSWSEESNIRWKTEIPGVGWSSPVVSAGRIYVTTSVGDAQDLKAPQSLQALCLDGATGEVIWKQEVFQQSRDGVEIHEKNSHASPTP
ncbi:MAG: PQQ-binding-like beta-propeller repeat protein, partial [Planctomycetaceae bacterium]|nr:PQQ-binding-like beta-propeller repeat protein [Planctomycetaceae bacterium]